MNPTIYKISDFLVAFIPAFLVVAIIFLLLRELVLWYFKINSAVDALNRIADSLENISATNKKEQETKESPIVDQGVSGALDPRLAEEENYTKLSN